MSKEKYEIDEDFNIKSHTGLKVFLGIIIFIGLLVFLGWKYYSKYYNNPKYHLQKAIETLSNDFKKDLDKDYEKNAFNISFENELESSNEKELFDVLKDIDLEIKGQNDFKNNLYNIELYSKYKDDTFIDIKINNDTNNNTYLYLNDIYDKYIKLANKEEKKDNKTIDSKDVKVIINETSKIIHEILNDHNFSRDEAVITIDNKEVKVFKNNLKLNNIEFTKLVQLLVKKIKENSSLYNSLKNIDSNIDDFLDEIEKKDYTFAINTTLYTSKDLKQELLKLECEFIYQDNHKELIEFDFKNELLSISSSDNIITIKKINDNSIEIVLTLDIDDIKGSFKINLSIEPIKTFTKIDNSNYIDSDKISEEELNNIFTKINENETLSKLITKINEKNM